MEAMMAVMEAVAMVEDMALWAVVTVLAEAMEVVAMADMVVIKKYVRIHVNYIFLPYQSGRTVHTNSYSGLCCASESFKTLANIVLHTNYCSVKK